MATFSTFNTADIAVLLRSSVEEKITVIPDEDSFAVDVSECRGYAHVKFDMIDPKLDPCSVFEGVLETASAQKVGLCYICYFAYICRCLQSLWPWSPQCLKQVYVSYMRDV